MTALLPLTPDTAAQVPEEEIQDGTSRFRRRRLCVLALGVVALVVFAPAFVAKTPLRHRLLPLLLPEYPCPITTGEASLLWWSPVRLTQVQFQDEQGAAFLQVEKIVSEKTLLALLLDQVRVGSFRIENPRLLVVVREGGSNLEDLLAPLFAPSEDSSGLDVSFQIHGGTITLTDPAANRETLLQHLEADVRLPLDPAEPLTVRGTTNVTRNAGSGSAGAVEFDLSYRTPSEAQAQAQSKNPATGTLRLKMKDLHLEALSAIGGRIGRGVELTGVVVADLSTEWTAGEQLTGLIVDGSIKATGVSVAASEGQGSDKFKLEFLTHQGRIEYQQGEVHLSDVALKSDVLSCNAHGTLNVPKLLAAWTNPGPPDNLLLPEFHLDGEINVARLAKMLPRTFSNRLREGLEIETGKILFALDAHTKGQEQHLDGKINTSRFAARADGREIFWDQPLELVLKARNTPTGPSLDELSCRSSFLTISAQGTPENAQFKASCRLDQLLAELNRFADLTGLQLAGRIEAGLSVRRLDPGLVRAAASAVVKDFRFAMPGQDPWQESQWILAAGADVITQPDQPREIRNASVRLTAGGDELELSQTEPLAWPADWNLSDFPAVALQADLRGELQSWKQRLRPWVRGDGWRMAGSINATLKAVASSRQVSLKLATADLEGLQIIAPGVNLSESRVRLETTAEWNADVRTLRLPTCTWASPSLSLRADDVSLLVVPEGGARTSGRVVFRGGLSELAQWFLLTGSEPASLGLEGVASGQLDLSMTDQLADANWHLVVEKAVLTSQSQSGQPQPNVLWSEDRLSFRGGGTYHFTRDHLELRPSVLESPWLRLSATGTLHNVLTQGNADLSGTLACNWPVLSERYRETLGQNLQIAGNEARPFSLKGPLWPALSPATQQRISNELTGSASVPWTAINLYGLPVGSGELRADVNLGVARFGPLDVPLGMGRLKFQSHLPLNEPVLSLQVEKGPLLENVRLSPELCRGWIKYAVPVLADSTVAEGLFSLALVADGSIPLATPTAANVAGVLAIESAQLRPGPLANSVLDVVRQVKSLVRGRAAGGVLPADQALVRLNKQNVNFHWTQGRMHHQGLQLLVGDVTVTSHGSVGFDETLALTLEIPIQAEWVRQNRLLAPLKGQTLKIPVTGTLSRPLPDTRAIVASLRQAGENAAGQLLENKLQNQFEQLFPRK